MALLGFLAGLIKPANLVGVFTAVNINTLVLQDSEDVIRAVVLLEVIFLLAEGSLLLGQIISDRLEGLTGSND